MKNLEFELHKNTFNNFKCKLKTKNVKNKLGDKTTEKKEKDNKNELNLINQL